MHSHLRPKLVVVHQQQASGGGRPVRSCDALNENGAPRIDSIVHKVEKGLEEFKDGLGRAARAFIHAPRAGPVFSSYCGLKGLACT